MLKAPPTDIAKREPTPTQLANLEKARARAKEARDKIKQEKEELEQLRAKQMADHKAKKMNKKIEPIEEEQEEEIQYITKKKQKPKKKKVVVYESASESSEEEVEYKKRPREKKVVAPREQIEQGTRLPNTQNISNEQLLALLKLSQSKAVNRPTAEINPAPPNPQQRPRPPPAPVDTRKQKMYNDLFKSNF